MYLYYYKYLPGRYIVVEREIGKNSYHKKNKTKGVIEMGRKRRRSVKNGSEEGSDKRVEVAGDSDYRPPSARSSPLGHSLLKMTTSPSLLLRYSTRRAKALFGDSPANTTSSESPTQNVIKDNISPPSPLGASRNINGGEIVLSNPPTNGVPSKKFGSEFPGIQVLNSVVGASTDSNDRAKVTLLATGTPMLLTGDKSVENLTSSFQSSKLFQELPELTSALAYFQEDGYLLGTNEVVPHSHQVSTGTGLPSESDINSTTETLKTKKQFMQSCSVNYTEIAAMFSDDCYDSGEVSSVSETAKVTVNGYRVKEEVAPVLRSIISKYGDIAQGSTNFSTRTRSLFLEMTCDIYLKLEKMEPRDATRVEMNSMLEEIRDLEAGGLDVKWLHRRLDDIYEALQVSKAYKSLKVEHKRNTETTERKKLEIQSDVAAAEQKKKEWEELEERVSKGWSELVTMKAKSEASTKNFLDSRAKMKVLNQPLVDGLL